MYDESTVVIPLAMSTDDYFLIVTYARRKNMSRTQFILDCVRQILLKEQEQWRLEQERARAAEKAVEPPLERRNPEGGEK